MSIDYAFEVHKMLNRKRTSIACIITALNEGPRISKVLDVVTNFPIFNEIVLVNDGSTDNTLSIMQYYALHNNRIKIVDKKINGGKTKAVKSGVKACNSELLCLFDADLEGLKFDYLYKMIYYVLNGEFDMTILDRASDRESPIGWAQSWTSRFNGGERSLWKDDYEKISFGENSKYAIEQEMNLYFVNHGLKVRTIYCPELKAYSHLEKDGIFEGLKVYTKMFWELYKHSKVKGFYYQVENIVEDRIEPLYDLMEKSPVKKPVTGVIIVAGLITSIATFFWLNAKKSARKISRFKQNLK